MKAVHLALGVRRDRAAGQLTPADTSPVKSRSPGGAGHVWVFLVLLVVVAGCTIATAVSVARYFRLHSAVVALIDLGATRSSHRPTKGA
jgi:hypothetical protein